MHTTKVTVSDKDIHSYEGDMLIFWASGREDGGVDCDTRILGLLQPLIDCKDFSAKENDTVVMYPETVKDGDSFSATRILVIGLGGRQQSEEEYRLLETMRSAGGTVSKICEKLKVRDAMVCADGIELGPDRAAMVESFTEGILLGDYRFTKYKKTENDKSVYDGLQKLAFSVAGGKGKVRRAVNRGAERAFAVHSARDMANEPGNGWTAAHFAAHAERLAEKYALTCRILDKAKMKRLGMGGILAVNQGSAEPPKLVILEYVPKKYEQTVMLVGKGLTFDSGGISIKPAEGMKDMKYDMCGGAAVLAAMQAIAFEQPSVRVVSVIPATDNMSGSSALKPGDIVRHYNGITSEIVSTDAEGRLILGDAIAYGIAEYKPDCVVDVATLTGAVIIGLGHHHTGILGNNDALVEQLISAGRKCGEPLWRLPLTKEYAKQIESQVADIKNTGGRPGGTITAAAYIEKFVGDTAWAHLDIAGTAFEFTEKTYIPKGPSGIMVRTLVEFVCTRG